MQPQTTSLKRLVLLDSHALLFRAFHAMPAFTTPDDRPSGAVYGFVNVVLRVMKELEPHYLVACFDAPGPTFRDELYPDYKATRPPMPEEIRTQEPMVKETLEALAIPHLALPGFEADDLIATLARQALRQKTEDRRRPPAGEAGKTELKVDEIVIVTGDRDLLQLADRRVKIYLLRRGIKEIDLLDGDAVTALVGVAPKQILDWKALVGDPSDNIPGVPGIGPKTANELIKQFGSVEQLYRKLENPKFEIPASPAGGRNPKQVTNSKFEIRDSVRQLLLANKERVFENRKLLALRADAPAKLDLEAAGRAAYDPARARDFLASLGFKGILERLPAGEAGFPGNPRQHSLF